jgi:ketosteroid isomerase-like protein
MKQFDRYIQPMLKRALLCSALCLVLAWTMSAEEVTEGQTRITLPDASAYSKVQREILSLERRRSAAIAAHDLTWLATVYAPDFRGIAAGGRRVDRDTLFAIFGRDNPDSRFLIDELEIRPFGTMATVTGRLRTTTVAGEVVGESRYLHVYTRRGGRWLIVSAAGSVVVAR